MIFPIDDPLARLSAVGPLLLGDLVFTGTPAGVGNRMQPPRYFAPGPDPAAPVSGRDPEPGTTPATESISRP